MQDLQSIKVQREAKVSQLITLSDMFFAFSNEQFAENKTQLAEDDKYLSIGMGAYLPKSKIDTYLKGMDEITVWYKSQIKTNKLRCKDIAYQLANHECYYTGELQPALDALGDGYTYEEVKQVYRKEMKNQNSYAW